VQYGISFIPSLSGRLFPSPSVRIVQACFHDWTYVFDKGNGMGRYKGTRGGINGVIYANDQLSRPRWL